MKDLVLYGAFDRYNYGDNLMPIVIEMFFEKYYQESLSSWRVRYASISKSDLSHYKCRETESIESMLNDLAPDSVVIVVGGEVLCARNSGLYMHMHEYSIKFRMLRLLSKRVSSVFERLSNKYYGTPWEFPYIPCKSEFKNDVSIYYNTVGGGIRHLNDKDKITVSRRLQGAKYISVRDYRTEDSLSQHVKPTVSPDSVLMLPDLVNDNFLEQHVSETVKVSCNGEFLVFQVSPNKIRESVDDICRYLEAIATYSSLKIILLPIGYASGHDDYQLLKSINKTLKVEHEMLYELSVWEILYVIKSSRLFIGTSLHGVITAMAYGIPHYGLNKRLTKLDNFLKTWSIYPFNQCYSLSDIVEVNSIEKIELDALRINAEILIDKVRINNKKISDLIFNS